jgi:anti-sigma factor RsiW
MARRFEELTKERAARDELLSAYLDGELGTAERARLEARLAADSALRAELEALRRTVALVRDLPPQPLPRNFILPQTAAPRRRPAPVVRPRWVAPFLTVATAAVGLLFVAVLAGDLLLSGAGGMRRLAAPAPVEKTVLVEEKAEEAVPTAESTAEELAAEAAPVAAGAEETATPALKLSATPVPAPATPEAPGGTGDAGGEERLAGPTPTAEASTLEADASATSIPPAPPPSPGGSEATEQALRETELAPGSEVPVSEEEDGGGQGEAVILGQAPSWRAAEIVLGLVALTLALATIWAWRSRRR